MPVVRWLAHVLEAAVWYGFSLLICTGLFLLSAHLGDGPSQDDRNASYFFRTIGALWLYLATWRFVVRGVFRRPDIPQRKGQKPTGAEVVRGTAGCIVRLAVIATCWALAGNVADWAMAGMKGSDTSHPARRASDAVLDFGARVQADPERYVPMVVGGLFALGVTVSLLGFLNAPRPGRPSSSSAPRNPKGASTGRRKRPDVAAANEAAVAQAARAAEKRSGVREAHAGAHRSDPAPPHSGHEFDLRESMREDRVLGPLAYSRSDDGWWARRPDGGFPVLIAGDAEAPDAGAQDTARQVVQRAFEVLLRASDAVRPTAQARGVGLPRFTITSARVEAGSPSPVTLSMRCESDAGHTYTARSSDQLQTFEEG